MIGEIVLDGGRRFSPVGIDGLHTLSLLLSSQEAHDRVACNTRETHNRGLTRGYSSPRQGGINSIPL